GEAQRRVVRSGEATLERHPLATPLRGDDEAERRQIGPSRRGEAELLALDDERPFRLLPRAGKRDLGTERAGDVELADGRREARHGKLAREDMEREAIALDRAVATDATGAKTEIETGESEIDAAAGEQQGAVQRDDVIAPFAGEPGDPEFLAFLAQ